MWQAWMTPALIVILSIGRGDATDDSDRARTARARELHHCLIDSRYEESVDTDSTEMNAALSPEKIEQVRTGVPSRIAPYRTEASAKLRKFPRVYSPFNSSGAENAARSCCESSWTPRIL